MARPPSGGDEFNRLRDRVNGHDKVLSDHEIAVQLSRERADNWIPVIKATADDVSEIKSVMQRVQDNLAVNSQLLEANVKLIETLNAAITPLVIERGIVLKQLTFGRGIAVGCIGLAAFALSALIYFAMHYRELIVEVLRRK